MPQDTRPEQQTEVGTAVALDSFIVYGPGNGAGPDMGSSPGTQMNTRNIGYRAMGKNILKAPDMPAVADFRKAVEETEKQQQQKKP